MLALYPLVLKSLRGLPLDEYAQAVRAPAWFVVVIAGAQALLSLIALGSMSSSGGEQIYVGFASTGPLLMADAYTLWGNAMLNAALMIGAWVPAARRSITSAAIFPFPVVMLLAWLAQIMLFSMRFSLTASVWLLLLAGTVLTWFVLFRPRRQWRDLELPLVLLFAAVVGVIGLLGLKGLAHDDSLLTAWNALLSASKRFTNGTVLLLVLGWLGPAIYLPWWIWARRDEPAMVWLPVSLLTAVTAQFTFVHTLYLSFQPASDTLRIVENLPPVFLIDRTLDWMMIWGVLALLAGSGWLAYFAIMRVAPEIWRLRPVALVAAGVLLLGISVGLQGQHQAGITGLLWLQLTWVGITGIWLAAGGMLSALSPTEQPERVTVQLACWLSLIALIAVPPGPGFRGLAALWEPMKEMSVPRALVVFTLVVTGICVSLALPRWFARQAVPTPRPGAAWGIIAPFLPAFLLLTLGFFGGHLAPLLNTIAHSLQQAIYP